MKHSMIVGVFMMILAFLVGAFVTAIRYEAIDIGAVATPIIKVEKEKEPQHEWEDIYVEVEDIDREKKQYRVIFQLPKNGEMMTLPISEIEGKVIQKGDVVKVHYIYDLIEEKLSYIQFVKDINGRIVRDYDRPVVVLDAGHGALDPGGGSNEWWQEKEMALKITIRMKEQLEQRGIKVIMTRSKDEYVSLQRRCEIANYSEGDLFISNHLNALDGKTRGVEVIYSQKADRELGELMAETVAEHGLNILRVYNRKDDTYPGRDYYFVHKYNELPSYIVEYGFADNEEDSVIIRDKWEDIVDDVSQTIVEYLR